MALVGTVGILLVGIVALWLGARWLVDGASTLAAAMGISPLVVGLTVVAVGTSAPEIVVSVAAALEGESDVAVGNVVGSNVFNLGVIFGLVAVLRPFRVTETLVRRDALAMAGATVIAAIVLVNRDVSRLEGVVLVGLLVVYFGALGLAVRRSSSLEGATGETAREAEMDSRNHEGASVSADTPVRIGREGVRLVIGLILVVAGGRALVDSATAIAISLGISAWLVGVTVVAAGTSVPELVTSVVATRRGDVAIAAGNVIGSNVFNLLGVLGFAGVLAPMTVTAAVRPGIGWLVVVTAIATVLVVTGRRVTRLEGTLLVLIGAGYWVATAIGV